MDRSIVHSPPVHPQQPDPADMDGRKPWSATRRAGQGDTATEPHTTRRQLEYLAWLMDESIHIPFVGVKVGLDGLVGLIPGIGDLITTGISSYIIRQAALLGVPKIVLLRMSFNTAVDFAFGAVPLVGDIFDLGWKANKRNVRLLLDHLDQPAKTAHASWWSIAGWSLGIVLVLVGIVFALIGLAVTIR